MIKVEEAQNIILENISPLNRTEKIEILSSMNRVLAEDIFATLDLPPFDNSAMDGYAVISSDTQGASQSNPVLLEVIDEIPAGYVSSKKLKKGEAIRIMTGAPIPQGADAVVIKEVTEIQDRKVKIFKEVKKGENIRKKGEDVKNGELVIHKGKRIQPSDIGMLASLNIKEVNVFLRPRVGILSTGDELVEIGEDLKPGKIRNSSRYSLCSQVIKYGGVPIYLGIATDKKEVIQKKIEDVIKTSKCDMLLISGGVSVGDYDFVKDVLIELGLNLKFHRVRMKPGKPLLFGMLNKIPVFGLPGNPGSSMVAFYQFVCPALLKMQGKTEIFHPVIKAVLEEDIELKPGRKRFIWAIVNQRNGNYFVKSTGVQSSGFLKSMVLANGLMIIPEDTIRLSKNDKVDVQLLNMLEN